MISYSRERQYKRIEDRKQFFFDDDIIACVRNVTRAQHAPVKHPANPLIVRDRPWEIVPLFRTPTFNVHYRPARQPVQVLVRGLLRLLRDQQSQHADQQSHAVRVVLRWPQLGEASPRQVPDGRARHQCRVQLSAVLQRELQLGAAGSGRTDPARRYKSVYILSHSRRQSTQDVAYAQHRRRGPVHCVFAERHRLDSV